MKTIKTIICWSPKWKFKNLKNVDAILFLGFSYIFWLSWEKLYQYTPLTILTHRTSIVAVVYFICGLYYTKLKENLKGDKD